MLQTRGVNLFEGWASEVGALEGSFWTQRYLMRVKVATTFNLWDPSSSECVGTVSLCGRKRNKLSQFAVLLRLLEWMEINVDWRRFKQLQHHWCLWYWQHNMKHSSKCRGAGTWRAFSALWNRNRDIDNTPSWHEVLIVTKAWFLHIRAQKVCFGFSQDVLYLHLDQLEERRFILSTLLWPFLCIVGIETYFCVENRSQKLAQSARPACAVVNLSQRSTTKRHNSKGTSTWSKLKLDRLPLWIFTFCANWTK